MSAAGLSAQKFDSARAGEYEAQSRIALAGYEACHDLSACILSAALGAGSERRILIVGVGGTAQEVVSVSKLEPGWRFVGVDPSADMLALAEQKLKAQGLIDRIELHAGTLDALPAAEPFDAAMMLGVLHHLPGDEAKHAILTQVAARLSPGAPLILAGNRFAYAQKPQLLAAWGARWRMHGASDDEIQAKLGKILQGADPPHSEQAVFDLLDAAGFERPEGFFSSLFWAAWIAWKK
jgi:tRNA (cmo5U34)-methyltransferase